MGGKDNNITGIVKKKQGRVSFWNARRKKMDIWGKRLVEGKILKGKGTDCTKGGGGRNG